MNKISLILLLGFTLVGCESLYDDGGIPRIRSQKQVDAYNATVSANNDKLVCTREKSTMSNIREFVCMTIGQQARVAEESREEVRRISRQ
jgi:putative hemolysin